MFRPRSQALNRGEVSQFKKDVLCLVNAVTNSFLDLDKCLKKNHKYFYQIEFQLFLWNFQRCDFIVCTLNWLHILEIESDGILSQIDYWLWKTFIWKIFCQNCWRENWKTLKRKFETWGNHKVPLYCQGAPGFELAVRNSQFAKRFGNLWMRFSIFLKIGNP